MGQVKGLRYVEHYVLASHFVMQKVRDCLLLLKVKNGVWNKYEKDF